MRVSIPVILIAFAPALASAQQATFATDASATATVDTRPATIETTGDAAADARIESAVARLEASDVSAASLAGRVKVGLARGVAPTRIAAAIEARAEALLDARSALRTSAAGRDRAMIELAADAIESGAHRSQVAAVVAGFDDGERARALTALGTLAAEGRVGSDAVATVRSALLRGSGGVTAGVAGSADVTASGSAAGAVTGSTVSAGTRAQGAVRGVLPR